MTSSAALRKHQQALRQCQQCPKMSGPPVTGEAVSSPVMLIGQAPGFKEIEVHRPFAWTAGKTLFKWFEQIGVDEAAFRSQIYMSAVCRCFPGKNPGGGDRVPNKTEIQRCSLWLGTEFQLLKPQLIIPVGKLAIGRLLDFDKLTEVVGRKLDIELDGMQADVIPLPHPSGASTWHRTEPGRTLLNKALKLIRRHPAWQQATDTR